jgi:hypothetical protein
MAGRAMGIATSGSVLGTLIGMFFLALFTPWLGELALKFGAYEFFWLALFGVIISGTLTGDDPLKGWMAGISACSSPASARRRVRLRPLHLRQPRPRRRHRAGAGAGRRLRLCRTADGHAATPGAGQDQSV